MNESTHLDLGIDHRLQPRSYRVHAEEATASTAVADLVASVFGQDPVELPPLHDVVDTDALNAFVEHDRSKGGRASISFRYVGCELTVYADGEIVLEPPEDDGAIGSDTP